MDFRQKRGVAGLLVAAAALLSLALSAPARADTVTDWNTTALTALTAAPPGGAGQPPQVATIHLAMVHGAVYDAVNAIDGGYQPYLAAPQAQRWHSKDAAAATAAHRVLAALLPAQGATLASRYASSLAGISAGEAKDGGIAVGEAAAEAMLAARAADGRFGPFRFTPGTAPGSWRPVLPALANDPNAWVKDVTPFMIERASDFRSGGPNSLSSRKYAKEFAEVKSLGAVNSTTRTADQTDMARFWAEGPAIWTRVTHQLSLGHQLGIADNARLFAMLYLTGADALIACWDDKAAWSFWRPITAIREAGSDGNRWTDPDPSWLPLINTPPYPDHPSGLACVISAMAQTSRDFFGTNKVGFSATSSISGTTRSFSRFSQAAEEVVDARVYSGIHFRIADEHGAKIGKRVAGWRNARFFRAAKPGGCDEDDEPDERDDGDDD
jgi:PAP2 superfamily